MPSSHSDRPDTTELCSDCPPTDYPTNKTRCRDCPRSVRFRRYGTNDVTDEEMADALGH